MSLLDSRMQNLTCQIHCTSSNRTSLNRQQRRSVWHRLPQAVAEPSRNLLASSIYRPAQPLQCRRLRRTARHPQWCRPPAATSGRRTAGGSDAEEEEDLDDVELTPLDGFEEEEVGDDDEDEDGAAEPDELENWTQKVVDWWDFATVEDDLTSGITAGEDQAVPWTTQTEKNFEYLAPNLERIREQNPDFVGIMPIPERKQFDPTDPPPEPDAPFANPDWDEWDYRAYVEKQMRIQRDREEWNRRRRAVGQYENLVVDDIVDLRLQMPWDERQPEWTNEQIFNLITLDGKAAMPADIAMTVQDPKGREDVQLVGGKYTESTEEFLRRTGHLMERPPTQEDLADLAITQLAGDFEGFEQEPGDEVDGAEPEGGQQRPVSQPQQQPQMDGGDGYPEIMMEEGWE